MKHPMRNTLGIATLLCSGACSDAGAPSDGPAVDGTFQLVVAPWESDSEASAACYSIEVRDDDGDVVWADDSVCTNQFGIGDNGTLNYVGLCDASGGDNSVSITLTELFDDAGDEIGGFGARPPTFTDDFECNVNGDTQVRASFLVVTQGDKGFLDVQVTVQEIACNAKIDCHTDFFENEANAEDCDCDISDPACMAIQEECAASTGTIVVALACNAQGSNFAQLLLDDVSLSCVRSPTRPLAVDTVDVSAAAGVHAGYPNAFVSGAIGNAGVSTDGTSFWTVALAIDEGWTSCSLSTRLAASDGRALDTNDQFPIIIANDIPFGFDEAGNFSCDPQPLDGEGSGLMTSWGSGAELDFSWCLAEDGSVGDCL